MRILAFGVHFIIVLDETIFVAITISVYLSEHVSSRRSRFVPSMAELLPKNGKAHIRYSWAHFFAAIPQSHIQTELSSGATRLKVHLTCLYKDMFLEVLNETYLDMASTNRASGA